MVNGFRVVLGSKGASAPGRAMEPATPRFAGTLEGLICFSKGTKILTPNGERKIEHLAAGDLVATADGGPEPIRWIGTRTVRATGSLAPICFRKGAIGNHSDLLVSPQHRMLCSGAAPALEFGVREVLVPAKALVDGYRASIEYGGYVTYVHMLFDTHQIIMANGAASESFLPEQDGVEALSSNSRRQLFADMPGLNMNSGDIGRPVRKCLTISQGRRLAIA